jgi:hypothetical protein
MKPSNQIEIDDINSTTLANIEQDLIDEINTYNDAVETGNNELAQMVHLSIQSLKRKREFWLKK